MLSLSGLSLRVSLLASSDLLFSISALSGSMVVNPFVKFMISVLADEPVIATTAFLHHIWLVLYLLCAIP